MGLQPDELKARIEKLFRYTQVGICVNGVAHDVNNLLGAIMAYAELIGLDEGLSAESRRMVGEILSSITKCSRLINNLTAVARKDKMNVSMADPGELVKGVILLRDYSLRVAKIKLETHIAENLASIACDPPKIQYVLIYMLLNAEENLQTAGGGVVRVTASNDDETLFLEVWDSGPPVSEETRQSMFAPYESTKEDHHLGLGLSAARSIAEIHEGTLEYDPERGFVVALPLRNSLLDMTL